MEAKVTPAVFAFLIGNIRTFSWCIHVLSRSASCLFTQAGWWEIRWSVRSFWCQYDRLQDFSGTH